MYLASASSSQALPLDAMVIIILCVAGVLALVVAWLLLLEVAWHCHRVLFERKHRKETHSSRPRCPRCMKQLMARRKGVMTCDGCGGEFAYPSSSPER